MTALAGPGLALFDLDGTLIEGDSDHGFGQHLVAIGWADAQGFAAGNDRFYAEYLAGTLDIHAYVDFVTAPWRQRPAAEFEAVLGAWIHGTVCHWVSEAALDLVRRHREAGDTLAIVTATNDVITRPIAALFGVPTLIGTALERDAAGCVTGRISGTPCFREGKIHRVREWLRAQGRGLEDFDRVHFYSDSHNDLPLLERVSHPVATNPGPALEAAARERGWPVIRLFGPER
jgi:HAD superfamily hydrolase (TIGR01490 family)